MTKDIYIVGRDLDADISINVSSVSRYHLMVERKEDSWYIVDNNSKNGTYLNSHENRIEEVPLKKDETIYLATYKLNTNRILRLINGEEQLQKVTVGGEKVLLGRNPTADIVIDNPNISLNHAEIVKENGIYYIYDLDSTNGTFINDKRVTKKEIVQEGDKITLGLYSFIFQEEDDKNLTLINISYKGFRVDVKNVSLSIKTKDEDKKSIEKTLLDDINLTIYPGEMVGLMGLSGAGKTTLLKILSGYTKPSQGEVLINGKDLYEHYDNIKNFIGYVPQDDIVHAELTVYEALFYSSKLRLSSDLTKKEIDKRIDKVLKDLGIYETKHVLIGSPDTQKGISGGQRKRVNIAMELLANPELIFLDEPTSGLSSVDTKIVMDKLKNLTDEGKTIILTIHQPSLSNYKKMDNVIILTHGKMAYFGSIYPESIEFFNHSLEDEAMLSQPDNALLGLDKGEKEGKNWKNIYSKSNFYQKFVEDRAESQEIPTSKSSTQKESNSFFSQLKVLTKRYLNIKLKDRMNTFILLIQAPIIAVLLILLFAGEGYEQYVETPSILLFILIISATWFGVINSVREVVSEKAIFERERLLGLKLFPYILSKFFILTILSLVQVVTLILIVNMVVPLHLNILETILIVWVTALGALSLGLLVSALAKSSAQALAIVPLVLLPMIIFAGGMIPINKMTTNQYGLDAYRVSFLMPTRWSLEELIRIYDNNGSLGKEDLRELCEIDENNNLSYINKDVQNKAREDEATCKDRRCIEELYFKKYYDDKGNTYYFFRNNSTMLIYSILFLFIGIFLLGTILILKRKDKH